MTDSTTDPAATAAATTAASTTTDSQRKEIFIRGLNFNTHELTLARHIETVAAVDQVNILHKNFSGRSKGIAFVTLKDPSKIDEVCEKLNNKPLEGRYLEISRAKPQSELPPKTRVVYRPFPPRGGYRGYRGGFRGYRGYRGYRGPAREGSAAAPAQEERQRSPVTRRNRQKEHNPNRTLSELTVAVLNLPYIAKENDMKDIFDSFEIVNPRICMTRSGLSKGSGFVTLTSHEEQQRAIEVINSVEVEGRKIRVVEAYLPPEELEAEKQAVEAHNK